MANLSDLIAQNTSDNPQKLVNLALATQMMGSGSGLGGTNYLFVKGDGTPEENAAELQAAYDEAKKMPRYTGEFAAGGTIDTIYTGQTIGLKQGGQYRWLVALKEVTSAREYYGTVSGEFAEITPEQAKSVRTTVIIAPGEYNFGATAFVVNEPSINIVSLTGNSDVIISSTESYPGPGIIYGIKVTADNILVKGIDCKTNTFYISNVLGNLICEHCIGGKHSFGSQDSAITGTFNNCTAGDYSFGFKGAASGTFNNCIAGKGSFGGYDGTASGTFTDCTGGDNSFGGLDGTFSGTATNCTGGIGSFGGTISSAARLYYCRLTSDTFPTPVEGGKLVLCIDGNDTVVTTS